MPIDSNTVAGAAPGLIALAISTGFPFTASSSDRGHLTVAEGREAAGESRNVAVATAVANRRISHDLVTSDAYPPTAQSPFLTAALEAAAAAAR